MRNKRKVVVSVPNQMPKAVRWPGVSVPFWQRLIVGPGQRIKCVLLSDSVLTYYCHYVSKTYEPCYKDNGQDCTYCVPNGPRRMFQGSIPVMVQGSKKVSLLNVTAGALRGARALAEGTQLYGQELVVWRSEGGRNAHMHAMLSDIERIPRSPAKVIGLDEVWKVQLNLWGVELVVRQESEVSNNDAGNLPLVPLSELGH